MYTSCGTTALTLASRGGAIEALRQKEKSRPWPSLFPRGSRTVTPYLTVKGAVRAIDFYTRAFGAQEVDRLTGPRRPERRPRRGQDQGLRRDAQ